MIADEFRPEDYGIDETGFTHPALFDHVGVTDPMDWRTVALRLAERYAPETVSGSPPPVRRKSGRPERWDSVALAILLSVIDELQADSRAGFISRDLSTTEAACDFLLNETKAPQAVAMRYRCNGYMPVNVGTDTLKNMVSKARKAFASIEHARTETGI